MNPFDKYLSKEQILQSQVCQWLAIQYPNLVWFHNMAEGKRSPFEMYLWKKLGAKSGVPDLLIFTPNKKFNGLAIEFKIKPNKCTPKQVEFMKKLSVSGWSCFVIYTFEETQRIIREYLC